MVRFSFIESRRSEPLLAVRYIGNNGVIVRGDFPEFDPKPAALAGSRFDTGVAAHTCHAFLDDGKANAGAGIFVAVEAVKEAEDLLLMFGVDTDAVVFDPDAH